MVRSARGRGSASTAPGGLPAGPCTQPARPICWQDGSWTDGETSFHTVNVWRDQAEHAAESLGKGARVIVVGRPNERSWTDQYGTTHQVTEVDAEELGPSLRWATATVSRTNGRTGKASGRHEEPLS